ncbi:hypothetical protein SAMN05421837_104479 [Amycolatopsis pretoriensis]|uniref:Uncharacterized protein n=1 Tax=Amycolatopsis pretoriensis TaxID=218821 RepID=A0A1H5QUX4_9PSEU|nr:hypothetical protein [Amycolatopsis pretoriensis]SEF29007.1 hypothetical protein SAMN05421837_104479 [Amycolatopsis pretoriensis]
MPFDGRPVPRIRTLLLIGRGRKGRYVDILDCTELPGTAKSGLVEGSIELPFGEPAVIGRTTLDTEVKMMWSHIAGLVAGYREAGKATTDLPDQPGELRLEAIPGGLARLTLAYSEDTSLSNVAGEEDLLAALAMGGVEFFEKLAELTGRFHDREVEQLTGRSGAGRTGPST